MMKQTEDPGIGIKFRGKVSRIINTDGSFNVKRSGVRLKNINLYYYLINLSWYKFIGFVFCSYLAMNVFFALLYFLSGTENLRGIEDGPFYTVFLQMFFFSVHTITTIGYGDIVPAGIMTDLIVTMESITGVLGFALATGLLYGRFSRPTAKIQFSQKAIIAPYRGISSLQFRIANQRNNELMELEAKVLLSTINRDGDQFVRNYYNLNLERSTVQFFPLTWTIVHPINNDSPLFDKSQKDLADSEAEILILIKGFDDTFSQTVNARYSYRADEIEWNARFLPAFSINENGSMVIELDKIGDWEKVEVHNQV